MPEIIVSCTTTRARLKYLRYTLLSIRLQSLRPDRFFLNISKEPYLADEGVLELPDWLRHENVEVRWVPNTGPYRKLIPTLQSASDADLVITIDDDVLYGVDWLSSIVRQANENPGAIVAGRGRRIRKAVLGRWRNYRAWRVVGELSEEDMLLPIGCAGVLYRKELLDMDFLSDPAFTTVAPTTDDLWFRMASLLKGVPVLVDPSIDIGNAYLLHPLGLESTNWGTAGWGFEKLFGRRLGGICNAYLGIKDTPNDFAWDAICRYANWPRPGEDI